MHKHSMTAFTIGLLAVGMSLSGCGGGEAKREVSRTVLVKQALTDIPGREGQIVLVEVPPGGATGKHTHPVDEFMYVLEGEGNLQRPGEADLTVSAKQNLVMKGGQVHEMKNGSNSVVLKFLQFSVPSPGQPLSQPAN
jgi:quercetin dioxygenase-like cupin family protein